MAEWKDITAYSQGDKNRVPRAWEIRAGEVKIVVTRAHLANPGYWTMHAYGLGIDTFDLKLPSDQPKELAQSMAINVAANKARELSLQIQNLKSR